MPPRTILIADPEPEVRSFVKTALRSEEYRVFEARGGLEALCVCACHPVDLLLVATDLAGIAGARLAEKLSHPFPTMRVLYLAAPAAGTADDVIAKPLAAAILRERIRLEFELATVRKRPATEPAGGEAAQQKSA
jgi:two-component system KDP operon response regulator KdpE